jgi:glyoxylase-like metal-dependent hydrolase (beta-lactamase superfamily II)
MINQVLPGIYCWSEYCEEKQLNFNGYYLVRQGESVIIDPPELDEPGLQQLQALVNEHTGAPLKGILLTNVHHERASKIFKTRFSVPVYIHEQDQKGLESASDNTFQGGEHTLCNLKVIDLQNQKSPGESVFLLEQEKVLIVGDALIGKIPGQVNLLPPEKYQDIAQAREGLQVLRDLDFDCLLVGDGTSIITDAKSVVLNFLDKK